MNNKLDFYYFIKRFYLHFLKEIRHDESLIEYRHHKMISYRTFCNYFNDIRTYTIIYKIYHYETYKLSNLFIKMYKQLYKNDKTIRETCIKDTINKIWVKFLWYVFKSDIYEIVYKILSKHNLIDVFIKNVNIGNNVDLSTFNEVFDFIFKKMIMKAHVIGFCPQNFVLYSFELGQTKEGWLYWTRIFDEISEAFDDNMINKFEKKILNIIN